MVIIKAGQVTRPAGASSIGPRPGTVVTYRLAQPIIDLGEQAEKLLWRILGIKGNTPHLQKNGDHTPWSEGKVPGVIYAIDVAPPADFEAWLVAKCRSAYDTRWIDFFNINGSQYNAAGYRVRSSDDHHLHISVARGYEDKSVTLFADYADEKGEGMPTAEDVAKAVWVSQVSSDSLDDGKPHSAHEGVINAIAAARRLKGIEDRLAAIERKLDAGAGTPVAVDAGALADALLTRLALALRAS